MVTQEQDQTPYGALFARYLEAGLQHSLEMVAADPHKVSEEMREQAWHLLSFALRSPTAWPATASLLLALSPKMLQAGYREQWLAYLEQGLACSRAAEDAQTAAALQLEIGELLRHLGQLPAAEACFQEALATFSAAGDTVQAAAAKVCLANLAKLREDWPLALTLCQEVIEQAPGIHYVGARALFVAADAHAAQQEDAQARDLYRASMSQWEALDERRWQALCGQNLAWLAARQGDAQSARSCYRTALDHFAALNARHGQAIVNLDWGITEYLEGNYAEALIHYQAAEITFRQLSDVRCLAMVCNNIGLLYLDRGEWWEAEPYYRESIRLWRELGAVLARISVEIGLARLWARRGDHRQALDGYNRLQAELARTERTPEHRRLYAEICDYRSQTLSALKSVDGKAEAEG